MNSVPLVRDAYDCSAGVRLLHRGPARRRRRDKRRDREGTPYGVSPGRQRIDQTPCHRDTATLQPMATERAHSARALAMWSGMLERRVLVTRTSGSLGRRRGLRLAEPNCSVSPAVEPISDEPRHHGEPVLG